MDIEDWRKKIDEVDRRLVELDQRAGSGRGGDWEAEARYFDADL